MLKFKNNEKIFYRQNQLTGLVYSLIKETPFSSLHNLPQNKPRFFNFSQLFLKNKNLYLIISSPLDKLIKSIFSVIKKKKLIELGRNYLEIDEVKIFSLKIKSPLLLKTETPVIVRIPQEHYHNYHLDKLSFLKNYPYFYWRPKKGVFIEPFIKQIEAGVYKKYKLFSGLKLEEKPIFFKYLYKKTLDLPYFKGNKKISRIGTLWEFEINPNDHNLALLKFLLDTGLGELNSQGYGFVNLKNHS